MKKLLIIAAAALLAAACARTYEVKETTQGLTPIGFGTWSETLTKARANGNTSTAFENGEKFNVYGYKTTTSDVAVFTGDEVEATVSGSTVTWDYAPHRFWDPAASSYTFFAVLPAGILAAEANTGDYAKTGKFTSTDDITFDDPTAFDNDILVANKKLVSGTGSAAPYSYTGPVAMEFNHVASCVDLKVKMDSKLGANAVVKVTALSLLNIHNKGKFTVTGYGTSSPYAPAISWAEPSTVSTLSAGEYAVSGISTTSPVTVSGSTPYDATTHAAGTTTGSAANLFTGYVFMPQAITKGGTADQQIKLSYTIQESSTAPENTYTDVIINIQDFMTTDTDNNSAGTAITSWNYGTKYIYTITIGANAITFSASVIDWPSTTINGYQHLLN